MNVVHNWFSPEEIPRQSNTAGGFYCHYPRLSRAVLIPTYGVLGALKVALFPVACLVGSVVLPLIATALWIRNKECKETLKKWGFCVLGTASFIAFLWISSQYLRLNVTAALGLTGATVSLVVHIRRAAVAPPYEKESSEIAEDL